MEMSGLRKRCRSCSVGRVVETPANGRMLAATMSAVAVGAASPLVVYAAYDYFNIPLIALILSVLAAMTAFGVLTLLQGRFGRPCWFEPHYLAPAVATVAVGALALCFVGYLAGALDLILLPIVGHLLALAWVQPAAVDRFATSVIGIALVPFVIWFGGRADEYISEALISGICIVGLLVALAVLRHRSRLTQSIEAC